MTRPSVDTLHRSIAMALRLVARHHGLGAIAVDVRLIERSGQPGIEVHALPLTAEDVRELIGTWEDN